MLWSGNTERYTIWENEFFNRSVGTIYDLAPRFSGGLAETPVTVDRRTGTLLDDGREIRHRYVLTDGSVSLEGTVVARDYVKGMLLNRVPGPLRILPASPASTRRTPGRGRRSPTRGFAAAGAC